ncbi:Ribosomal protein L6 [Glarea lozoyensis ATCC 20868]|uniref:Ribosomal protein L6 n=1 Tax=Glarea lozoyensis (strain ATCC 20868 / MF5171) TaxID=1116229 RepID=S3D0V4_GLAL2|nr:Ribosomal protein L6 [Glarea lozoyensis ATCC 20868]EPE25661.1 Ribosomal protein L6 [Glarea lozoyensis ATCC 20868]
MLSTARSKGLERAFTSIPSATIPSFLLPAFRVTATRCFSTSPSRASQIGRAALSIPPEVKFEILPPVIKKGAWGTGGPGNLVKVEGPLGSLSMTVPSFVNLEHDTENRKAYVSVQDKEVKKQREMWGTTRAYLQNHILGVSEGHTAILRLVGVGYRATIETTATTVTPEFPGQTFVALKVGYSHPIELPVPKGVKASTPQPTRILLEGVEKEVILSFAAKIRMWRKPEPYKGKGIFVNGETIKLKAKKIK